MEYRKLGDTGLGLSVIGFGCWAMGGGWGKSDDKASVAAVELALDYGINFFDTADIYGFGYSEILLARALGRRRKDIVIATKGGLSWDEHGCIFRSSSKFHIQNALEASLKRLKTDYIDLYQIHWPDENTPLEVTVRVMEDFIRSGKVRYIGVSNFSRNQIREWMKIGSMHSIQPPYNMLMREKEKDLQFCSKHGIGAVTYGTLAYGLLTGKFNNNTKFPDTDWRSGRLFSDPGDWQRHIDLFQGKQFRRNLKIVEKLTKISEKLGKSVGQLAIGWVLSNKAVTSAIVGAKRPSQLKQNIGGIGWGPTKEDLLKIDRILGLTN